MVNQFENRVEYPAEVSLAGGKGGIRDLVDALLGAMPAICPGFEGEGGGGLPPGKRPAPPANLGVAISSSASGSGMLNFLYR